MKKIYFKYLFLTGVATSTFLIAGCSQKVTCDSELLSNKNSLKTPLLLDINSSSQTSRHPIGFAFDGNNKGDSFWETTASYPHIIGLNYSKETIIDSYSLTSGLDKPKRMPSGWDLEASCDGKNWSKIDSRRNINSWEADATSKFDTSIDKIMKRKSKGFKYYRFRFVSPIYHYENPHQIMRIYDISLKKR
tara:strand:- start:71 stop:643 length:573 start_codon:yes stop_codon:yes gene_type:complete